MSTHAWVPSSVPWWVPYTDDVRFDAECEACGAATVIQVTIEPIDVIEPCAEDET